jgi:hypothetical protein
LYRRKHRAVVAILVACGSLTIVIDGPSIAVDSDRSSVRSSPVSAGWLGPVIPGSGGNSFDLVTTPDASAHLVWGDGPRLLLTSTSGPTDGWSKPRTIAAGDLPLSRVQLAAGQEGTLVAHWYEYQPISESEDGATLKLVVKRPGEAWSTPSVLALPPEQPMEATVSVLSTGEILVAWTGWRADPSDEVNGGGWWAYIASVPAHLSAPGAPQLAVPGCGEYDFAERVDGSVVVSLMKCIDVLSVARIRSAGSITWGDPVDLNADPPGYGAQFFISPTITDLRTLSNGSVVAMWSETQLTDEANWDKAGSAVRMRVLPDGKRSWSETQDVIFHHAIVPRMRYAVAPDGDRGLVLVTQELTDNESPTDDTPFELNLRRSTPDGTQWSSPQPIPDSWSTSQNPVSLSVASNSLLISTEISSPELPWGVLVAQQANGAPWSVFRASDYDSPMGVQWPDGSARVVLSNWSLEAFTKLAPELRLGTTTELRVSKRVWSTRRVRVTARIEVTDGQLQPAGRIVIRELGREAPLTQRSLKSTQDRNWSVFRTTLKLRPGRHDLLAEFEGATAFAGSESPVVRVRVRRGG